MENNKKINYFIVKRKNKNSFNVSFIQKINYKSFLKKALSIKNKNTIIKELIEILKNIPFKYYMLKSPCLKCNVSFQFNINDETHPMSKMKLDCETYKKYFKKNEKIAIFMNPSGKTKLIVPKMLKNIDKNNYLNISTFSRNSPLTQQIELWRKVFREMIKCDKTNQKCYLNTHGLGIGWLHVRIDKTPKYYKPSDSLFY